MPRRTGRTCELADGGARPGRRRPGRASAAVLWAAAVTLLSLRVDGQNTDAGTYARGPRLGRLPAGLLFVHPSGGERRTFFLTDPSRVWSLAVGFQGRKRVCVCYVNRFTTNVVSIL